MRNIALIPLRGGSKGIPNKNIKKFLGKPLCEWVLKAALKSKFIDEVYVSSDSSKILNTVSKISKKINLIKRSSYLAKDSTATEDVIIDFMDSKKFDNLILIQATSPLTESIHLDEAGSIFMKKKLDSLFTAVRTKRFFWKNNLTPINYNYKKRPNRQDFKGTLMENGAFYIFTRELMKNKKSRLGGKIGVYEMDEIHSLELDEITDWEILQRIARNKI